MRIIPVAGIVIMNCRFTNKFCNEVGRCPLKYKYIKFPTWRGGMSVNLGIIRPLNNGENSSL